MVTEIQNNIPRVIHYFWLGGNEKPESVNKCIESWKKFCPDFEIREWNESNYDVHKHLFMEKAYREQKWAFVVDYGRLDVLYQYGGIYLDTDVEVLKDLSPLCCLKAFKGFENDEHVNDGQGFGCVAGFPFLKEMMACYDGKEPYNYINGREEYIESPQLVTRMLLRHGLRQDGSRQMLDDINIFPVEYFCPLDYETGKLHITENTFSIHHFDGSWHGKNAMKARLLMQRLNRIFGKTAGKKIFSKLMMTKDVLKKLLGR